MSAQVVVENQYATLLYDPETKIVQHIIRKPVTGPDFRDLLEGAIDLLRQNQATKWLSDDRKNLALSPEDNKWAAQHWFPEAIEAGWQYWALIVPPNPEAQISLMDTVHRFSQEGLRIMIFTDPAEGLEWLESM